MAITQSNDKTPDVVVHGSARSFRQEVVAGKHNLVADEPVSAGGSDGGPNPYRFRMRDPSFITLQTMPVLMPGHLIADTMAVMASLDPIMGGVDK